MPQFVKGMREPRYPELFSPISLLVLLNDENTPHPESARHH
jgi:hypothetical protein